MCLGKEEPCGILHWSNDTVKFWLLIDILNIMGKMLSWELWSLSRQDELVQNRTRGFRRGSSDFVVNFTKSGFNTSYWVLPWEYFLSDYLKQKDTFQMIVVLSGGIPDKKNMKEGITAFNFLSSVFLASLSTLFCSIPPLMVEPASSSLQYRLKTSNAPGIFQAFNTRLIVMNHPGTWTKQLFNS